MEVKTGRFNVSQKGEVLAYLPSVEKFWLYKIGYMKLKLYTIK